MSGCGCGCKIKLKVDDESPIGLQIIDGETVRVGCADFLIRTDKDYNHLENKPSINNVELVGNKSLAELGIDIDGKLDKPLDDGINNAILKNVAGEKPKWSPAAFVADRDGTASSQGQSILSVGTEVDENTSGGYIGIFRMLRTKGTATSHILLFGATPTFSVTRQYRFGYNTPNTLANVLSSSADNNIVGAIAKFESGTSVIAGVAESALELNTNKVSTISQDSTDDQYPSAKCVYESIEDATPETLTNEEIDAICI